MELLKFPDKQCETKLLGTDSWSAFKCNSPSGIAHDDKSNFSVAMRV